jgi:hypothetical protein
LVTFYVSNSLCSGTRIPVTVTVNPTPNLSSVATNVTVCGGNCVTIGQLTPEAGVTYAIYNSTSGTSVLIASSSSVSVCPKKPSIYTLVATNKYGCSKSITINVNVANNNPSFSLLTTPNSGYFTLSATPTVSYSVANSVPGFGYVWIVEELDDLDNVLFTVYDPLCWQNFSTTPTLVFNGLDDVANSYTGSVTLSSCSTPSVGKFVFGHRYRVTRATWNSYCPWDQYSDEAYPVKNMITGETEMRIVHNVTAPDFSGMFLGNVSEAEPVEEITLYPNPSDGIFTVNMLGDIADQSTVFMIYDIAGRLVTTMNNMGNTVRVDLSGQPSGTYLVHIKTGNRTLVKKVSIVKQ